MGNIRVEQRQYRHITQNSSGTSSVSIPIEYIRALSWHKGQRVKLVRNGRHLMVQPVQPR